MNRRDFLRHLFAAGLACPLIARPVKKLFLPPEPELTIPPHWNVEALNRILREAYAEPLAALLRRGYPPARRSAAASSASSTTA